MDQHPQSVGGPNHSQWPSRFPFPADAQAFEFDYLFEKTEYRFHVLFKYGADESTSIYCSLGSRGMTWSGEKVRDDPQLASQQNTEFSMRFTKLVLLLAAMLVPIGCQKDVHEAKAPARMQASPLWRPWVDLINSYNRGVNPAQRVPPGGAGHLPSQQRPQPFRQLPSRASGIRFRTNGDDSAG